MVKSTNGLGSGELSGKKGTGAIPEFRTFVEVLRGRAATQPGMQAKTEVKINCYFGT